MFYQNNQVAHSHIYELCIDNKNCRIIAIFARAARKQALNNELVLWHTKFEIVFV